jgi:hypothetical protein
MNVWWQNSRTQLGGPEQGLPLPVSSRHEATGTG